MSGLTLDRSAIERIAGQWRQVRFSPIRGLTPEILAQALDAFEAGWLRQAALIWEAIERRDGVVAAAVPKRKKAVARRPWEILTIDDSAEALQHKELLEHFYNNLRVTDATDLNVRTGFSGLVRQMMDAVMKRYAVHEIVWQPAGDRITAELRFVPLYFFENRTGRLRFVGPMQAADGEALAEDGWMITVADGIAEAISVAYMFKRLSLQDWLAFSEKFGTPGIHGETTAAPGSAEWDSFIAALQAFARDWIIGTSAGSKINLIEASSGGDAPFSPMVEYMDRVIAMLCRGADLSTLSRGDSQGASLQGEESDLLLEDDCTLISETLNEQIDRRVIAWRFGDDVQPLAYVKIQPPQDSDTKIDLEVDKFLLEHGARISVSDAMERYGRTAAGEGDPALERAQRSTPAQDAARRNPGARPAPLAENIASPIAAAIGEVLAAGSDEEFAERLQGLRERAAELLLASEPQEAEMLRAMLGAAVAEGLSTPPEEIRS